MSKKTLTFITVILGAVEIILCATTEYLNVSNAAQIKAIAGAIETAVIAVCTQFVKTESAIEEKKIN